MYSCLFVCRYTPAELRELPLNTVMNERREEVKPDSTDEQTDAAAAAADVNVGGDSVANDDKDVATVKVHVAALFSSIFTCVTLASAGISCRRVSVCLSVCHKSVFC